VISVVLIRHDYRLWKGLIDRLFGFPLVERSIKVLFIHGLVGAPITPRLALLPLLIVVFGLKVLIMEED